MKKLLTLVICLSVIFFFYTGQVFALTETKTNVCNQQTIPRVIKPLADYEIVSTNVAFISTASAFSGEKLNYSFVAHPKNKKNIITIDQHTGKIRIEAEAEDQFDIKVTVKNICGKVSDAFNVKIDEEKG